MKNLRQELIDLFSKFHQDKSIGAFELEKQVLKIFDSINSNEPNEFRAVGNNENTQEKCDSCKEYERGIEDGKIIAEHGTVNWID